MAYRTSLHSSIGNAPNLMVLGRLWKKFYLIREREKMVKVIEEYVADLQKKTNRYVKLKNLPENISKKIFVTKRNIVI